MEKNTVIVIDRDPEAAEEAKSLLRNAGLAIQTRFLGSTTKLDDTIGADAVAVIIGDVNLDRLNLTSVLERAAAHDVPVAVRVSPEAPERVLHVLDHGACLAVHADEADQQVAFVRSALDHREGEQRQGGVAAQLEELDR